MKTLKQILLEIHTKQHTKDLLDLQYAKQSIFDPNHKKGQLKNTLPNKTGKKFSRSGFWQTHDHFENPEKSGYHNRYYKNVPIHKISSTQGYVGKEHIMDKLHSTARSNPKIPYFVFHEPSDTYHLVDANHRTNMRHLRGFKHIRGLVINSKHIDKKELEQSAKYNDPTTQPPSRNVRQGILKRLIGE